jgi:hypothetical protein
MALLTLAHQKGGDCRQRPCFRLYELFMFLPGQKCVEPRDAVFGLLGVADSHIVPDYDVSITRLFLHVLVEGLLDIEQHARGSQLQAPKKRIQAHFYAACLQAFNFSTSQWTVNRLARLVFDRCTVPSVLVAGHECKDGAFPGRRSAFCNSSVGSFLGLCRYAADIAQAVTSSIWLP